MPDQRLKKIFRLSMMKEKIWKSKEKTRYTYRCIPSFNIALLFYRAWADREDKLDQCLELQVSKTLLLIAVQVRMSFNLTICSLF
jgi:hypothetical protein